MPDEPDDNDPANWPPYVPPPFPTAEELAHMVVFRCTTCTEVVAIGDEPANYDAWLRQQIEVYGWTQGPAGLICSDCSPPREPREPPPPRDNRPKDYDDLPDIKWQQPARATALAGQLHPTGNINWLH